MFNTECVRCQKDQSNKKKSLCTLSVHRLSSLSVDILESFPNGFEMGTNTGHKVLKVTYATPFTPNSTLQGRYFTERISLYSEVQTPLG